MTRKYKYAALVAAMDRLGYKEAPQEWGTTPRRFKAVPGRVWANFKGERLTSPPDYKNPLDPGDQWFWFVPKEKP
jgi:hypothetical protein